MSTTAGLTPQSGTLQRAAERCRTRNTIEDNAIAGLLDRAARVAKETEEFLGDQFQDGAYPHEVHDALPIARAVLNAEEN